MEPTPHWKVKPSKDANFIAARLNNSVRQLLRLMDGSLSRVGADDPTAAENLKKMIFVRAEEVSKTPGAISAVQGAMMHSTSLALQCYAQNPTAGSVDISPLNFPSFGEERPSSQLPIWRITPT